VNAPPWLPNILAVVMLVLAAYSVWRIAIARVENLATDYEADALHALSGLALAGLLVRWMDLLPRGLWTALFIAAAAWFAGRALYSVRDGAEAGTGAGTRDADRAGAEPGTGRFGSLPPQARRLLAYAAASLIMVYMFVAGVAPSTLSGSTAGEYTMAGMPDMIKDTTISYPTLGLLLTAVMAGYAVVAMDRIAPVRGPGAAGAGASRRFDAPVPSSAAEGSHSAAADRPPRTAASASASASALSLGPLVFAPRTVECCRILLCITAAYAILAKIV
jgi:hypothetical protein